VVIDLQGLSYMDSTGLRALLDARDRAAARGRRLAFLSGSGPAHRVIALTGADALLESVERPGDLRPGRGRAAGGA
jgi:anti-anti-sigma factor